MSLDFYNELVSPVDDLWFCSRCLNETTDEATTDEATTCEVTTGEATTDATTTDATTTGEAATAELTSSTHMNLHCAYLNASSVINNG